MSNLKFVLGSQSSARKDILKAMGYRFKVLPANIDEKLIRLQDPIKLTLAIAHAKADVLISKVGTNVILITSDQVVVCNKMILEKPTSVEEARSFFSLHNKYPAETVTSVVVVNKSNGKRFEGTDIAKIWFKEIPDDVIEEYIASGNPFIHAGGFDHEHYLIQPFIDFIQGEPESISGLPIKLTEDLIQLAMGGL